MPENPFHAAYLVRWKQGAGGERWQSSVENAYTGEVLHFKNQIDLLTFLWKTLSGPKTSSDAPNSEEPAKRIV